MAGEDTFGPETSTASLKMTKTIRVGKSGRRERETSNKEREREGTKKRLEEPKFDVTKYMAVKNFSDCWTKAGEKGEIDQKETCM